MKNSHGCGAHLEEKNMCYFAAQPCRGVISRKEVSAAGNESEL